MSLALSLSLWADRKGQHTQDRTGEGEGARVGKDRIGEGVGE